MLYVIVSDNKFYSFQGQDGWVASVRRAWAHTNYYTAKLAAKNLNARIAQVNIDSWEWDYCS